MNKIDEDLLNRKIRSDMKKILGGIDGIKMLLLNKNMGPPINELKDISKVLERLVFGVTSLLEVSDSRHSGLTEDVPDIRVSALEEIVNALSHRVAYLEQRYSSPLPVYPTQPMEGMQAPLGTWDSNMTSRNPYSSLGGNGQGCYPQISPTRFGPKNYMDRSAVFNYMKDNDIGKSLIPHLINVADGDVQAIQAHLSGLPCNKEVTIAFAKHIGNHALASLLTESD